MPRRLTVTPHRGPDERHRRVGAIPASERVRRLAVRPAVKGRPATEGGPPVGLSPDGVCAPGRRAHGGGRVALANGRRGNPGAGIPLDAL